MDVAEIELQRRKERARRSQRAFRIRQANALRDLREENARLKDVIKEVSEASQQSLAPLAPDLRSAIHKAAFTAGFGPNPDLEIYHDGHDAPTSPEITRGKTGTHPERLPSSSRTLSSLSRVEYQQETPLSGQLADDDCAGFRHLGPSQPPPQQVSSCMSFRLNCGLLGWPTTTSLGRIMDPPVDIAPYLGPNSHTLEAQIYWYCTETSLNLLYHLAGQQPSKIISVAQHHPVFVKMLRHVSPLVSHQYLLALAEARLEFYRVGYCKADNLAAARDLGLVLRQRVEEEFYRDAAGLDQWYGATKVARLVEDKLQQCRDLGGSKRLEAAVQNDGTDVAARSLLYEFIKKLFLQGTCFGDGPRWKASYVSDLVEWLARALVRSNLPVFPS